MRTYIESGNPQISDDKKLKTGNGFWGMSYLTEVMGYILFS